MKQNKEIFEKYADKLLIAMKAEKLMNKEVAGIFNVPQCYMTPMGKHPERVAGPFMEKIRTWAISGKPLRDYKLPEAETETQAPEPEAARDRAEMKFRSKLAVKALLKEHTEEMAAAVNESANTEEPTPTTKFTPEERAEIAAEFRKEYEAVQPQNEIVIVAHKGGKVDVSRLDPRTGQVAAAELYFNENGDFSVTYRFKS